MVASAVSGEGKTLTSTNLALTFSESYRRQVLLIDADLRRPSIHTLFALDNHSGLTDGLRADTDAKLPVVRVTPRLAVLTAGRPAPDPMSLLTSAKMADLVAEAATAFDWVVIDTPPVGLMPDANLLASMVDVALLVIAANRTPFALIQRAVDALGRQRITGVVLNRTREEDLGAASGYYGYYGYGASEREAAPRGSRTP
jgi:protein-tyrosine kinase